MRIIISPAKKMVRDDVLAWSDLPALLERTEVLRAWVCKLSFEECQRLWGCNARLAQLNYERFHEMDLRRDLTPALLAFEGIQYQYMAAGVLEGESYDYLQEHLRILSGFYGVLRPLDGVVSYRLEMGAKAQVGHARNLYDFWGSALYEEVVPKDRTIVNLASAEYSRAIERHLAPGDRFVTAVFGELVGSKVVQKGAYAKMARGEMVRYLAERKVQAPEEMQGFSALGYGFDPARSDESTYVFLRKPDARDA